MTVDSLYLLVRHVSKLHEQSGVPQLEDVIQEAEPFGTVRLVILKTLQVPHCHLGAMFSWFNMHACL
jgi:cytochrome oxidase assembly protein ShyY1